MLKKNKKKIFIAGASGMVGTYLIEQLLKKKFLVTGSYNNNHPKINKKYFKKYNFKDFNSCLKATKNVNTLYLLTMVSEGVLGLKNKDIDFVLQSLKINLNLIEAALKNRVKKIIFLSSSTIYQPYNKPIPEKMLDLNLDPYEIYLGIGWYYRYLEKFLIFLNKKKSIDVKIIRTSAVYGEYDSINLKKSRVIPSLIMRMLKSKNKENFEVWGNPNIVRDFVYVGDVVKVLINSMKKNFPTGPLNFSYGKEIKIKDLAKEINLQVGRKLKLIFNSKQASSANYRVLLNKRLMNLNLRKTDIKNGLKKTIKWYKSKSL